MNEQWRDKLASLGVELPSGELIAAETNLDSPVLAELSHLDVVEISGEDAQEFLQNQVCNDLTSLTGSTIQLNGYCNPKGRLLALFTIFEHEQGFRLIVPSNVTAAFVKRLQMYVMRAKVTITVRDDLVCSGLVINEQAAQVLSEFDILPAVPSEQMSCSLEGGVQLLRVNDSSSDATPQDTQIRCICIGEPDVLVSLWESDKFQHADWSYWRWSDINAGMPNVYGDSVEQFIPLMLNMQHINGLSFKKGCYPGQEIVARMYYLGKLKKHMQHVRVPGVSDVPKPGDVLATESNNNAGQVVDAIADEHGINLLAVVNIATPVEDIVFSQTALTSAPLPYSMQVEEAQG